MFRLTGLDFSSACGSGDVASVFVASTTHIITPVVVTISPLTKCPDLKP